MFFAKDVAMDDDNNLIAINDIELGDSLTTKIAWQPRKESSTTKEIKPLITSENSKLNVGLEEQV